MRRAALIALLCFVPGAALAGEDPRDAYERARRLYFALKESKEKQRFRHNWIKVIAAFREVSLNWPRAEEAPRAVYTAAELWRDLYGVSRKSEDLDQALLAYEQVAEEYPQSSLADDAALARARIHLGRGDRVAAAAEVRGLLALHGSGDMAAEARQLAAELRDVVVPTKVSPASKGRQVAGRPGSGRTRVTRIEHWSNPAYTRVSLELAGPARARSGDLEPAGGAAPRLYVDVEKAKLDAELGKRPELGIGDGLIAKARLAQHDDSTVRLVLELEAAATHRVLFFDNPHRVVLDVFPVARPAAVPAKTAQRRHVVIDPGHGGRDGGAKGPGKVREKEVVLAIAAETARLLEAAGVRVTMTRSSDVYVSLDERAALANRAGADAFVSIHANSNPNRNARGIESYYLDVTDDDYALRLAAVENQMGEEQVGDLQLILADLSTKANTPESMALARVLQKELVGAAKPHATRDLGVKGSLFYVLLGARMPAVLVETSFLSHPEEGKLLGTAQYQKALARALADGLVRHLAATPLEVATP